jgi:diguanylate cyclase (GGDEF)-like protein
MRVQSDSQVLAPGSPASSAHTDDPAPTGGGAVAVGLEAGEAAVAAGRPALPADRTALPARRQRTMPTMAASLAMSVIAVAALIGFAAVRIGIGTGTPLGAGLAAVPLFFAAAFLGRRGAIAAGLGTVVAALAPIGLEPAQWSMADAAVVAETGILAGAAIALRAALLRATSAAAREAAQQEFLADRLHAVAGIAERLATSADRDASLRAIATEVNEALAADATSIRLPEGDRMVVVASSVPGETAVDGPLAPTADDGRFRDLPPDGRPIVDDGSGATDGASVIAPLVLDDRAVGALTVAATGSRRWSPADLEFLRAVATHASLAVRNAELLARTESWAAQLAVLQAASSRMSRQNTVGSVGRAIVEEVAKIIDYHNCRVYVIEEPDDVVPIAFEGRVGAYEDVDLDLLRTKLGEGVTGWVAANGEPLLVDDVDADPRAITILGTDAVDESMLCVPMRYDERVIGVITLSKLGLAQFDHDDLRLLNILADQAAAAVESARVLGRSDRLATELRRMLDMSSALAQSLDPQEVAQLIARHLVGATGLDECAISWWDQPGDRLLTLGYWPPIPDGELQDVFDLAGFPETTRVLHEQVTSVVRVADPDGDAAEIAYLLKEGAATSVMLPLVAKGRSIGLVELMSATDVSLDQTTLELAWAMANEAAMALENARHYQDARALADRDRLTGFFNHRYLHERLGEEVIRAQRSKAPLSLLMIDLDDFKLVNDTFGHLFGDRVLAWTAEQIRSTLRASDIAARYGGDEFAIILPDSDRAAAHRTADRIVATLRQRAFESEEHGVVPVGASIGVAAFPADGRTGRELIAKADVEMYRVKLAAGGAAAPILGAVPGGVPELVGHHPAAVSRRPAGRPRSARRPIGVERMTD